MQRWKLIWLEMDAQWALISPLGVIVKRFYSLTAAEEFMLCNGIVS